MAAGTPELLAGTVGLPGTVELLAGTAELPGTVELPGTAASVLGDDEEARRQCGWWSAPE